MDTLLTEYLDADEAIARGDGCPGCDAAWHTVYRNAAEAGTPPLMVIDRWELRHALECPYRRGFAQAHLGRLTGEILAALGSYSDAMNDPITVAYGAGADMSDDWWRSSLRQVNAILDRYGVHINQLLHMLDERCSPKYTYESGLGMLSAEELETV